MLTILWELTKILDITLKQGLSHDFNFLFGSQSTLLFVYAWAINSSSHASNTLLNNHVILFVLVYTVAEPCPGLLTDMHYRQ